MAIQNPIYKERLDLFLNQFSQQKKTYNVMSTVRVVLLITFLLSLYFLIRSDGAMLWIIIAIVSAVAFFVLIRKHMKLAQEMRMNKALADINQNEHDYLEKKSIPFANGKEHIKVKHAYTYDLDIFGENSLYHRLNRTATFVGSRKLAKLLSQRLPNEEIISQQEAIKEVASKMEWRQEILAVAMTSDDSEKTYNTLMDWTRTEPKTHSSLMKIISFVLPILTVAALIAYVTIGGNIPRLSFAFLFLINLGILGQHFRSIKDEVLGESQINKSIQKYSRLMYMFESQNFESEKLQKLQKRLLLDSETASHHIANLSRLFQQLDSVHNPMGAIIFNGMSLYHVHTIRQLQEWKATHASKISDWMEVLGEVEAINSLSNFAFNNTEYTYPRLNTKEQISFTDLGHPMLADDVRICNDVEFIDQKFIILTGSNMSGKSTFLRSLGINMVLASAGAPVCASDADIHPLDIYVSMRLSDSLTDNESYFFAEVKRLKEIMDAADSKLTFILLDEILRGTNSDDKRQGTVEVIKKLISKNVIGAIATHDLKVCDTTADYPTQLINKNFEVEIEDGELVFDYKLRDGVCKNKSATYIMKKMEII